MRSRSSEGELQRLGSCHFGIRRGGFTRLVSVLTHLSLARIFNMDQVGIVLTAGPFT